ncbi:predicted protein [Histoplasma capsulatum G186AR]|uniref:Uncharacterized protein n=1 Tax=Ajellomyces capsulatus (strain G186AR / H82 / ATCC MYA-2454 / RMSCC 2432) TaxID=447093 RepID=C0NJE4_AJECG|nr:uncharacterized protein HCBG_03274 [Histoplasma capsulatum G186AR]EEH07985.1 predicted protein [Histoplasma capsulatum G186AR]
MALIFGTEKDRRGIFPWFGKISRRFGSALQITPILGKSPGLMDGGGGDKTPPSSISWVPQPPNFIQRLANPAIHSPSPRFSILDALDPEGLDLGGSSPLYHHGAGGDLRSFAQVAQ